MSEFDFSKEFGYKFLKRSRSRYIVVEYNFRWNDFLENFVINFRNDLIALLKVKRFERIIFIDEREDFELRTRMVDSVNYIRFDAHSTLIFNVILQDDRWHVITTTDVSVFVRGVSFSFFFLIRRELSKGSCIRFLSSQRDRCSRETTDGVKRSVGWLTIRSCCVRHV